MESSIMSEITYPLRYVQIHYEYRTQKVPNLIVIVMSLAECPELLHCTRVVF